MSDALGLSAALATLTQAEQHAVDGATLRVGVACSFTALHLETFVRAYVAQRRPGTAVLGVTGIYGDLPGTLAQFAAQSLDACVLVLEWGDLDPRLGMRESVSGELADADDIGRTARQRLERVAGRTEALASTCPTVVVLPSLELPAVYDGPAPRLGRLRAALDLLLADWAGRLVATPGIRVVRPVGGAAARDLRAEIRAGFPYTVGHASKLARTAVAALFPAAPKKGLITDLDDTLWRGLAGEIGPDALSWELETGGHVHGLYQQLLSALGRRGTLIAVASKNDLDVVEKGLGRPDLLLPTDLVFPVAASWGAKSAAVSEILRAWNIAASDVVFVDDNPMELAEVASVHPDITAVQFPARDPAAVPRMLADLAELLWRDETGAEDSLRVTSLRSSAEVQTMRAAALDEGAFLRDLDARITIGTGDAWRRFRALELVNKTNQFNLNGRRFDEAQWRAHNERTGSFAYTVSYEDRFGPLGVISVLAGVRAESTVVIDCWVLSCRAFSRAIEHHVLGHIAAQPGVEHVGFEVESTERNTVVRDFLAAVTTDGDRVPRLDRELLRAHPSSAVHTVVVEGNSHG